MASAKENDQDGARTALARRRGHGEGAIYRDDARGRWVGQIDLGLGLNGKRRRPKVFGRTKTEVRARLDEIRHSQATGLPIASGDRLGEHLDWWLANSRRRRRRAQELQHGRQCQMGRRGVDQAGARRPAIRDLKPEDVEGLLAGMARVGKSRSSIDRVRSYLGQALAMAERHGKVARNVVVVCDARHETPSGPEDFDTGTGGKVAGSGFWRPSRRPDRGRLDARPPARRVDRAALGRRRRRRRAIHRRGVTEEREDGPPRR